MAKPRAAQLEQASGLSPLAKDWIKALVREAVEEVWLNLPAKLPVPEAPKPTVDAILKGRMDDITERVVQLEERYADSEKYALTKAKVIRLLKEEGIE